MKKIAITAAMVAIAGAAGVASAQPAERGQRSAEPVSRADFVNRAVERVQRMDADNDGMVTAEERRAFMQSRRAERLDQRFTKLDANGDGMISRAEFEAGHAQRGAQRGERMGRRGPGGAGPARAARLDRAERTVTVADARARAEQAFDRMDRDGDGYVTREERREMRGERRANSAAPAAAE